MLPSLTSLRLGGAPASPRPQSTAVITRKELLSKLAHNAEALFDEADEELEEELLSDRGFLIDALTANAAFFQYIPPEFQTDRGFLIDALTANAEVFKHIPFEGLQRDEGFVLEAIARNGDCLFYVPLLKIRRDVQIQILAAKTGPRVAVTYLDDMVHNLNFLVGTIGDRPIQARDIIRQGTWLYPGLNKSVESMSVDELVLVYDDAAELLHIAHPGNEGVNKGRIAVTEITQSYITQKMAAGPDGYLAKTLLRRAMGGGEF